MNTQIIPALGLPQNIQAILSAFEQGIDQVDRASYPPYNVYHLGQDEMRIEMAVAGFADAEIEVTVEDRLLKISGAKAETEEADERRYTHRGLAQRNFRRSFRLGQYVQVEDAALANGILTVHLRRELPEAARPRTISISKS